LEHAARLRREQYFEDVAEWVPYVRDRLTLSDRFIDTNKPLHEASVLAPCVVECGDHVCVAEIRLNSRVCGCDLEIDHDTVYVVDYAVDKAVVPDLGLPHLDSEGWDTVVDKGGLDGARLAGVNLQGVRLQEFGQTLDVGEAEVGVAP
jgi:hypothetical protein